MQVGARWGHPLPGLGARMLTDAQARQAKAKDKDYKLSDSGGLYLFVSKTGHKTWRLKYRYLGKEKRLMIGTYPDVRLSDERSRRDSANRVVAIAKAIERRPGLSRETLPVCFHVALSKEACASMFDTLNRRASKPPPLRT